MQTSLRFVLAVIAGLVTVPLHAQMVDPAMDRPDEPFSYFSKPTDVIGVIDARGTTLVSPEGYLFTGYGELMFFTGAQPIPVDQRVKTLRRGNLPVVEYRFEQEQFEYKFTMFAATPDGKPSSPMANFVRVQITNVGDKPRTNFFSVATRYQNEDNTGRGHGDNRFRRPATAKYPGEYWQPGIEFDPAWVYGFRGDAFVRDGKVMYLFPQDPKPTRLLTLKTGGYAPPSIEERALRVLPTTPVGIVQYPTTLAPKQKRVLEFRMPYEPLPHRGPQVAALRAANFDEMLARAEKFWDDIFARGIEISVPELKAADTFKASLVYPLIARDHIGEDYIQNVNKFNYRAFWLRDASFIVRMYDLTGYHDYARQALDFFAKWQQPDGNFVSQGGQYDGWGQTLWAYGQHYRITGDKQFASRVYPAVKRAVEWLKTERRADPLGLMPVTTPGDNEDITGHVTGHNFWALGGLKNAIVLAEAVGNDADAREFSREYDEYETAFLRALKRISPKVGGAIPPGLDEPGGQDWGNLESLHPEIILDPWDPMVTATLKQARAKYKEGIMTYADETLLHHYLTIFNTETQLVRGEQQQVIEEFYALLLHTSSTHAGFEYCIPPWGTRDFSANLTPHGWFAAKFRILMRNMLVREQGNELHLLSAISPEWIRDGQQIIVRRAPTNFGEVNYTASFGKRTAEIIFGNRLKSSPVKILLHIPWFMKVESVLADGRGLEPQNGAVSLPLKVGRVDIKWTRRPSAKVLSYEQAVRDYKFEYRRRYERFLSTGESLGSEP